jgi:hypothetical protein
MLKKDALRLVVRVEVRSVELGKLPKIPNQPATGAYQRQHTLVCGVPRRDDGRIVPIIAASLRRTIAIFLATIAGKKKQQPS